MKKLLFIAAMFFSFNVFAQSYNCQYRGKHSDGTSKSLKFNLEHGDYQEVDHPNKVRKLVSVYTEEKMPEGMKQIISVVDVDNKSFAELKNSKSFAEWVSLRGGLRGMLMSNATEAGANIFSYFETTDHHAEQVKVNCTTR